MPQSKQPNRLGGEALDLHLSFYLVHPHLDAFPRHGTPCTMAKQADKSETRIAIFQRKEVRRT